MEAGAVRHRTAQVKRTATLGNTRPAPKHNAETPKRHPAGISIATWLLSIQLEFSHFTLSSPSSSLTHLSPRHHVLLRGHQATDHARSPQALGRGER